MEYITLTIIFLLLVALVIGIFFLMYKFVRLDIVDPIINRIKFIKGLPSHQKAILARQFQFYNELKPKEKTEFERRLNYFIEEKEFISKGDHVITDEMKVLVGASAVQLTFGYAPLRFPHFQKILLFPGRFYSKDSNKLKKGEVNSLGMIVLSWKDFIHDYKIPHDGVNLGLHEMAHALKIEDMSPDGDYAILDDYNLQHFYNVSKEEYARIRRGEPSFIRSYGGTDMEEFFAVCIEQFFEQPTEFKHYLPELYDSLATLLNQDPARNKKF